MTSTELRPAAAEPPVRVMIVDDALENLQLLQDMLCQHGGEVLAFASAEKALKHARLQPPDLILLDTTMPDMSGYQVCQVLKAHPRLANVPVIFLSARDGTEDKLRAFGVGGVDFISKPFQFAEVQARVDIHLRLHALQKQLSFQNAHLQVLVEQQVQRVSAAQQATIFALAKLVEIRDDSTGGHLERVREYCRMLAETLRLGSPYASQIDSAFVDRIYEAAPLHDIGKVAVPDAVLLKAGPLTDVERQIMQSHAAKGEQTLREIAAGHGDNPFINMGIEIAGGHHEHWNGSGYPRGLAGTAIPLSARIVAVADMYDELRSIQRYKPARDHADTVRQVMAAVGRQLDPVVVAAFADLEKKFDQLRVHSP